MRINKKYDELLQYLESATDGKEITWKNVKGQEGYRAAISNNAVFIKNRYGKEGGKCIECSCICREWHRNLMHYDKILMQDDCRMK